MTSTFGARTGGALRSAGQSWFGGFGTAPLGGAALLAHGLPGGLELVYRSDTDGRPIVAVETTWEHTAAPTGPIQARLLLDDQIRSTAYFDGAGLRQGDALRFVLRGDAAVPSGAYAGRLELVADVGAGPQATAFEETVSVVNHSDSPFGPGWTLNGLEQVVIQGGGVLYQSGTGVTHHFAGSGGGLEPDGSVALITYEGGSGEMAGSALEANGDGTRTLTHKGGLRSEFDGAGRLTARVDLNGNTTSFTYDTSGNLTRVTEPYGRQTDFAYAGGRVASVTDWAGRTAGLGRDGSGRLTSVTPDDPDGSGPLPAPVTSYAYDAAGRVSMVTDPLNRQTTLAYDHGGRLDVGTRPGGVAWRFDPIATFGLPDVAGGVGTQANPAPIADPAAAASVWTDPLGHTRRRSVNANGDVVRYVGPSGATTLYQRDADGRITQQTDPDPDGAGPLLAPVTVHQYDASGNLTRTTHPDGAVEQWTYHATLHRPLTHTDPLGAVTHFTYDTAGNLLTVTDPLGYVTTSTYDARGLVLTVTRPDPDGAGPLAAPVTSHAYDGFGRRVAAIDPLGRVSSTAYDAADRPIRVTRFDPAAQLDRDLGLYTDGDYQTNWGGLGEKWLLGTGGVWYFITPAGGLHRWDGGGATGPLVAALSTAYYSDPRLLHDSRHGVVDYAAHLDQTLGLYTDGDYQTNWGGRDEKWFLGTGGAWYFLLPDGALHRWDGSGTATGPLVAALHVAYYDTPALLHDAPADPGTIADYAVYDALGRLVARTDPMGHTTTLAYDALGRQTSVTDPLGRQTTYAYDLAGNLQSTTRPDPDGAGPLAAPVTSATYDGLGRVLSETDPLGATTTYAYDADGHLLSVTRPDPDGAGPLPAPVTTYAYDALGRRTSVTDPLGEMTTFAYDAASRLISSTDPEGGVTGFSYDAAGRRAGLLDPVGNATSWTYDALGRVLTESNISGATRSFTYDAAGDLIRKVDRDGRETRYSYDALGRLVEERWIGAGGSTVKVIALGYDRAGRLTTIADDVSAYTYSYDALGRLSWSSNAGTPGVPAVVLSSSYDAAGRRTGHSALIGGVADFADAYSYDALGRLTQIMRGSAAAMRVDFAYDAVGRFAAIDRYADLSGTRLVAGTSYAYDAAGRLTALTHAKGATTLVGYTWSYDAAGRLIAATSPDGTTSYAYDATGQLTSAVHSYQAGESYSYDLNGNRTMAGYATGTDNRLLSDGTSTYASDAEGRRTRRTAIATGDFIDYEWDHRGRLTAVTHRTSGGAATKRVAYTYDVHNRRIGRAVDLDGSGTIDEVTRFVYDGVGGLGWTDDVVLVFDGSGALRQRLLHGPAVDQVLAVEDGVGTVRWYLADHLGTVRDVASHDAATGATMIVNHLTYDSFGIITGQTDAAEVPAYAFTGREWDADAGLYSYRARWYDAVVGRFLSGDPLGFDAGDANAQRYVGNGPTNAVDPTGLMGWGDHLGNYWHYLTHPWETDPDIQVGNGIAYGLIGTGVGGLAGLGAGGLVSTGVVAIGGGTTAGGIGGGLAGGAVGGAVGGAIGSAGGGELGGAIGGIGGGFAGGLGGGPGRVPPRPGACFVAGTPVVMAGSPVRLMEDGPEDEDSAADAGPDETLLAAAAVPATLLVARHLRRRKRRRVGRPDRHSRGRPVPRPDGPDDKEARESDTLLGLTAGAIDEQQEGGRSMHAEISTASGPVRPSGGGSPGGAWVSALLGLATTALLVLGLAGGPGRLAPADRTTGVEPTAPLLTKPIEQVRLGDRVHVELPEVARRAAIGRMAEPPGWDRTEVDPATWRRIDLMMTKSDGGRLDASLLRPHSWIDESAASVGGAIHLALPEQGFDGPAEVLAIGPCPEVGIGPGQVVTGTFTHVRGGVLELRPEGVDESIGATENHPFWSEDRQQYVPAGELRAGETLRHLEGSTRLVGVRSLARDHRVFNIEVHAVHVYHVTDAGLLVHNNCPTMTPDQQALKEIVDEASLGGRRPLRGGDANTVLDWANEVNYPGWRAGPADIAGDHYIGGPHIHIPGVGSGHVPVGPGVRPR